MISIPGSCLLVILIAILVRHLPHIKQGIRFLVLLHKIPTAPYFVPLLGNFLFGVKIVIQHRCSFPTALHILGQRVRTDPSMIPGFDEVGCFKFWVFVYPVVVISSPETAANLYASKTLPKSYLLQKYIPYGLLTIGGDLHKYHRRLLSPYFTFALFRRLPPIITRNSDRITGIIRERIKNDDGVVQSMHSLMGIFAVPALLESAMGLSGDQVHKHFDNKQILHLASLIKYLFDAHMKRIFFFLIPDFIYSRTPAGRRMKESLEEYDKFTEYMIQKYKEWNKDADRKHDETSLMDILVSEHERNPETFTQKDLYGEFKTFFAGGFETYITTFAWLFHYVGNRPDVQEKMMQEQDEIFRSRDREGTIQDFKQMKYMEAVIKETLRIQSSVPGISRYADQDYLLNTRSGKEILIPKYTEILIYQWIIHRDPFHWPDPDHFDPDRFVGTTRSLPQGFVPFSSGHRSCIGQKYAMTVMVGFLSTIVRRFTFRSLDPIGSLHGIPTLSLMPDKDVRIQFTERPDRRPVSDPICSLC